MIQGEKSGEVTEEEIIIKKRDQGWRSDEQEKHKGFFMAVKLVIWYYNGGHM